MDNQPLHILHSVFGYERFRGPQADVIGALMAGGDALVLMPTGGGKSLCFQIPAIARAGTGIVVSPLIALMQDQVAALKQAGVRAAFLNSTLDAAQARAIEAQLLRGELDLLYVAPERLLLDRTLDLLARVKLALFAIDEAHCVSQWGHDFRPEYMQLSVLHERFPEVPRIALTATADEPTRREIVARLKLEDARVFISSFDRPNIRYRIGQTNAGAGSAREQLLRFIRDEHAGDAGIVYCLSAQARGRNRRLARRPGPRRAAVSRRPRRRGARRQPVAVHQRRGRRHRRHHRLRHGHRQAERALRRAPEPAEERRGLLPGNRPRRARRAAGRRVDDLRPAGCHYPAPDAGKSESDDAHKRVERHKLDAMLGLCELTTCRRQALLAYFAETLPRPCGNCDTCLEAPETWDATVPAQKALSCVHRTGATVRRELPDGCAAGQGRRTHQTLRP